MKRTRESKILIILIEISGVYSIVAKVENMEILAYSDTEQR